MTNIQKKETENGKTNKKEFFWETQINKGHLMFLISYDGGETKTHHTQLHWLKKRLVDFASPVICGSR